MRYKPDFSHTLAMLALVVFALAQSVLSVATGSTKESAPELERCPIEASLAELPDAEGGTSGGEGDPAYALTAAGSLFDFAYPAVTIAPSTPPALATFFSGRRPPARAPPFRA